MKRWLILTALCAACSPDNPGDAPIGEDAQPPEYEPPVALNAAPPVIYPIDLFEQQVEGTVRLRLYLLADGSVVPESTRVEVGSGHPALDSAAMAGVPNMTFSPARRMGVPVETEFIQPVHFRHPDGENAAAAANEQR